MEQVTITKIQAFEEAMMAFYKEKCTKERLSEKIAAKYRGEYCVWKQLYLRAGGHKETLQKGKEYIGLFDDWLLVRRKAQWVIFTKTRNG